MTPTSKPRRLTLALAAAMLAATALAQAPGHFTMTAVGDVMLDRAVGAAIAHNGASSILAKVRDQLRRSDIRFCNLECPLSRRGAHDPKDCVFRADPSTVKVLLDGGFNIVSVANNHTHNSGTRTFLDTLDCLEKFGIKYAGGRRVKAHSWWPTYMRVGGMVIGFMAYTDLSFKCGSWNKVDPDLSNLKREVSLSRRQCDLLVVSFHWGEEYHDVPTARQRRVARAAIDAGAGLVLGHHPHVLEGMTAYKGAPILYSMGNFVFDQKWGERMQSAIFDLSYEGGRGWSIVATPVTIHGPRFGPDYPPASQAHAIAKRLIKLSVKVGSYPRLTKDNTVTLQVRSPRAAARARPRGE